MSYINEQDKFTCKVEDVVEQRTPDVPMSLEQKNKYNEIVKVCKKNGLDGYDYIYEFFNWDEIAELAAYGGFPVRYPHYLFGMEFEHMRRSYEYGYSKIYEMVVPSNPCYAYLLASNSEIDNMTVIAHAYAHNDFCKNNKWFSSTNMNMINEMASHGTKIRRYCSIYGRDKVIRFLNLALSIEHLINFDDIFKESSEYKESIFTDEVITEEPRRLRITKDHEYMGDFINPEEYIQQERARIKKEFSKKMKSFPENPTRDVIGFMATNSSRLRNWMRDILFMIREESLYFVPIRLTKILNEGWASFWDQHIMIKEGFAGDSGIIDYAQHHAGVLGGKYSRNPYAVGNLLFNYVKDKWDKGKFGPEWEECRDLKKRQEWDKKLGLGMQKIFEIRSLYNDYMFIDEFMDQDFCDEYEFYSYEKMPDGKWILKSRDVKDIKKQILSGVGVQSLPIIQVKDANALNQGHLLLEHVWTGRTLSHIYAIDTLKFLCRLWGRPVALKTYAIHSEYDETVPMEFNDRITQIVFVAMDGKSDIIKCSWEDYCTQGWTKQKQEK